MSDERTTKFLMWSMFLSGLSIGFNIALLIYKLKQP
jgi:hypothetical protein